jgi:hypothetical protein
MEQPAERTGWRITLSVVGLVGVMMLAGCSAPIPVSSNAPQAVVDALVQARDDGLASDEQIGILEAAARDGVQVSEGDYRNAYNSTVACVEDAGITVLGVDEGWNAGVLSLTLSFQGTIDSETVNFDIIDRCERTVVPDDATYQEVAGLDATANDAEGTQEGCIQSTGFNAAIAGPPG